jgi:ABC-2 type transport system permease protein
MNTAKFKKLFLWELANTPRRLLLWVVVGILFAAFLWGALNASALRARQAHNIQVTLEADARKQAEVRKKVEKYQHPSDEVLQYWQDPTDIDSTSRYFLYESAIKPPLPLAALSVGQSDLLPFILPMKLETAFGIEPEYDFEHPRGLALGVFDLGFAIVFFLPIGVILLVTMFGAFERDHGILRLAAAQAVSPRMLLGSKMLALGTWLVPMLLLSVVLALVVAGTPIFSDIAGLLSGLLVIGAYALFWFTLAYLVLSFQKGAAASASVLIAIWAAFAIIVPKGATFATAVFVPASSYVQYIDKLRTVEKDVMQGGSYWHGAVAYWLDGRPEPEAHMVDPAKLTYAAHLIFAAPERERRLQAVVDQMASERAAAARWTILVKLLSPPVALQDSLATIAGNNPARHARFIQSAKQYQADMRGYFYPRIERQILSPHLSTCVGCPGRLSFVDHDRVPKYRFPDQGLLGRVGPALLWSLLFAAFSAVLCFAAMRRGRRWRVGELV